MRLLNTHTHIKVHLLKGKIYKRNILFSPYKKKVCIMEKKSLAPYISSHTFNPLEEATVCMCFDCLCACDLYQSLNGMPKLNMVSAASYTETCLHTYTITYQKRRFSSFEQRFFNSFQWTFCLCRCCVWLCSRSLHPFIIDTSSHTYQS